MTWLGITEGESEAEKDGIRESGCWQLLAKPLMPPLGNTQEQPPYPQGSGSPNQVGSLEGRREAGGGRREAGGSPSPGCLGPQEETAASKFHSKLLAAQTCSRGGAQSPSRLRGIGGRWGGWGRKGVGVGAGFLYFTARRGEERVGVSQSRSQGKKSSCGGQSPHVERGAHPGRRKTKD